MKVFILSILCFIFLTSCFGLNSQDLPSRFGLDPVSANTGFNRSSRSSNVFESVKCKRARRNAENAERDIERSEDDLEDAEEDLKDTEDDLSEAEDELRDLQKTGSGATENDKTKKREEIADLKADEDKYENRIEREEDDIDDAEDDLRDAERDINRHC